MRLSDLITPSAKKESLPVNGAHLSAPLLETAFTEVPLEQLNIDRSYQRDVDKAHVANLVKEWRAEAVGALRVARRPDGSLWIVDGQHRFHAMRVIDWTHALCHIQPSQGVVWEAKLFEQTNNHRKINILNLFRALLVAGDSEAKAIAGLVRDAGWSFAPSLGRLHIPGETTSVERIEQLYRRNPTVLTNTLELLINTWPEEPRIGTSIVIHGMFLFLTYGGERVNRKLFARKLASGISFAMLLRRAKSRSDDNHLSPAMGIAQEIAAHYNVRLQGANRVTFDRAD